VPSSSRITPLIFGIVVHALDLLLGHAHPPVLPPDASNLPSFDKT
jgi:hypothetical protein